MSATAERIVTTTCASHCGGSCILKLHVKGGTVVRIETDDSGDLPQLRGCLRGRAYRQRIYAPDRLLYPMKRIGERGEGRMVRISWDEAIDTVASEIARVRDTYGPETIVYLPVGGDLGSVHNPGQMARLLAASGGYTQIWGVTSFQAGMWAQRISYGSYFGASNRDDLPNSRMILLWGWNPTSTIAGVNTNYYLLEAKKLGAKIVAVDPQYTDSAALYADLWVPIRPATDGAMLLGMAYVMMEEGLQDQKFLDKYTVGYEQFANYVLGKDDGIPKTPRWAEAITGVPAQTIAEVGRQYATIKPAALLAGIAPGRTHNGEQYHRIAIALAAMTGNVGIHGGDAAGRAWESIMGNYHYNMDGLVSIQGMVGNPVDDAGPRPPRGSSLGYKANRIHYAKVADMIERGKEAGYPADCRLLSIVNCSYLNCMPNVNKVARAMRSPRLEFTFVLEQFMTPTVRYSDIVLPTTTYFERDDFAKGVGLAFYGLQPKAVEPLGETKSHSEIVNLLGQRLGLDLGNRTDDDWVRELAAKSEIPDLEEFKRTAIYRIPLDEPYVAYKAHIDDIERNPFHTKSGKIDIYAQGLAEVNNPALPPIPTYIEAEEGWADPLRAKYPLQLITTHHKRRANNQFENLPWLRELAQQALTMNTIDAQSRGIRDGQLVRVFNDRGTVIVPARVTERIMPGVVDLPHGAWYDPDENGIDRGGCANVLTNDNFSAGGSFTYNSSLVQVTGA